MKKFIYVFSTEARDKLIDLAYELLTSDERNNIYVFLNKPNENFALNEISAIESDTLTF